MNTELKQLGEDIFEAALDVAGVLAIVSGTRLDQGASAARPLSMTTTVIVGTPQIVDMTGGAITPTADKVYGVKVSRRLWPDATPPQAGDTFTFADVYPPMSISGKPDITAYGWTCLCIGREGG